MVWWHGAITGQKYVPNQREARKTQAASALTAAAFNVRALREGRTRITPGNSAWQDELWGYYDTLGEFFISVTWRAYMISRVRLRAGRLKSGSDEPEIMDKGPAADLVNTFAGGTIGQVSLLRKLSVLLDVPAEAWLVGETRNGKEVWRIHSNDEIQRRGQDEFQIVDDRSTEGNVYWRTLGSDSMITRIWRPSDRFNYLARSPAFSARSSMRELELVNRHIVAQYLSRLASAGVVMFPDEMTFPVRDEFMDAPDPFVREWIETAAEAIRTPGSASAVIPMPFRVPAEYVDKIKHIDFTVKLDDKIIEKRDSARKQLTTFLNVPTDLLFGAGDVNHWGLWQLEESAIKTYISGDVELMMDGFTRGYMTPYLQAQNVPDADQYVFWYDASELMVRPDKSQGAKDAYDRMEISGKALRRESGFDEDDAPTDEELGKMVLRKLALMPQLAIIATEELTGLKLEQPEAPIAPGQEPPVDGSDDAGDGEEPSTDGPPDTRENTPPPPDGGPRQEQRTELTRGLLEPRDAFAILQAKTRHIIKFSIDGFEILHPLLCQEKQFSCPYTHATWDGISVHPGAPGTYECWLNASGNFVIGTQVSVRADELIPGGVRTANAHSRS
jgi:hypothetical protein